MHNLIRLHGRIDRAMYESFKKRFEAIPEGEYVYLHINSTGGYLDIAWEIEKLIIRRQNELKIVGIGYKNVHSAAIHILLACTFRIGYSNVKYLMHLPKSDGSELGDRVVLKMQNEEIDYFARMLRKSKTLIYQLMQQEIYLTAYQAEMLGILNFKFEKVSKFS